MIENDPDFSTLEQLARQSRGERVWLRVGQAFDGRSKLRDVDLVFDAKQIHFAGPAGSAAAAAAGGAKSGPDLILSEYTAMPCLIEAHSHAFLEGAPIDAAAREAYLKQPRDVMLARAEARWPAILQCGIGAVRDAGDKHGVGLALAAQRKRAVDGRAATPWIDSPGAAIFHRGRYGAFMGKPIEDHGSIEACVASRVQEGADRIKLLVSGIIDFKAGRVTAPPQMSGAEVATIVRAARSRGRQTFAHASGSDGVQNSIEGGVTTIEHGFFLTGDQLAAMRDRNIGWVPTFAPVQAQIDHAAALGWSGEIVEHLRRIIHSHQTMLCRAERMGVKVIAGSDAGSCGVPHGAGFLDELSHMERAGMSTATVLGSATGESAEMLEFPEKCGRLAPGFRARLILTRHDPTTTVANLRKAKFVLFDGAAVIGPEAISTTGC